MKEATPETSRPALQDSPLRGTPEYYQKQLDRLEDELAGEAADKRDALDIKREYETWVSLAESKGIDLKAFQLARLDPLRQVLQGRQLIEMQEPELLKLRESMDHADALGDGELDVKKKWMDLIDLTLALQRRARGSALLMTVYVVRCQSTGDVLRMSPIHAAWFAMWNDPDCNNTLIEAPPGTGKTTCLYGQDIWDLAHDPRLRILKQCGDVETANKRLGVVRLLLQSGRFRSLFPEVRIDPSLPDNAGSFTLVRRTISQDATMEAAGPLSNFQGAGYDVIEPDDLCPQKVRWEKSTRDRITSAFNGVTLMRRRDLGRSKVRFIATPWHTDDTTSRLLREIREGKRPGWRAAKFPVAEDADGNPIPPVERAGLREELLTLKRTDPAMYACACRLDSRDRSLRKLDKLVYYDVSGGKDVLCPEEMHDHYADLLAEIDAGQKWRSFDPAAGGEDQTGDVGFRKTVRGRAAIISADFYGLRADKAIQTICEAVQADDNVLIESQGPAKGIADLWAMYLVRRLGDDFANRIFFSGTRFRDSNGRQSGQNLSKDKRYFNCLPLLADGVILFPGRWEDTLQGPRLVCVDDPGLAELHDQLLNYPDVARDDGVDALSLFVNYHAGDLIRSLDPIERPRAPRPRHVSTSVLGEVYRERCRQQKQERSGLSRHAPSEAAMFSAA